MKEIYGNVTSSINSIVNHYGTMVELSRIYSEKCLYVEGKDTIPIRRSKLLVVKMLQHLITTNS